MTTKPAPTGVTTKPTLSLTSPYSDRAGPIVYETRISEVKKADGTVVHRAEVEVPKSWGMGGTNILSQKYLRRKGVPSTPNGAETSAKQWAYRLAYSWAAWGQRLGILDKLNSDALYREASRMLLDQVAAPNSPQHFNTGLFDVYGIEGPACGLWAVTDHATGKVEEQSTAYRRVQASACFITAIKDDLVNPGGIMDQWTTEARLFKGGSGIGANFSRLRGAGEQLSGGGKSSGLMSWLGIGDRAAGSIKSGGTTRRAAKMVVLDDDHPDIEAFIDWKVKEEEKVAALVAGHQLLQRVAEDPDAARKLGVPEGYVQRVLRATALGVTLPLIPPMDTDYEGEAYGTVSGQNSNNSIRVSNLFLAAVESDRDWNLLNRTNGQVAKTLKARALWEKIAVAAWACADPGLQFDDTINDWHTCPNEGHQRASNPCSEFLWVDGSSCNLASLNLVKFLKPDGTIDVMALRHATRVWTIILEISVGMSGYPTKLIAEGTWRHRTVGLGFANLGALLMRMGLAYDSDEGRAVGAALTAIITGTAYETSAEMAAVLGPFAAFESNREPMLRVIRNHARAVRGGDGPYEELSTLPIPLNQVPKYLREVAIDAWDRALALGEQHGYRNAQVTVIAPAGTIGLLMDCDTTGVEPDFALVKHKTLAGGGDVKIVNESVAPALVRLGYPTTAIPAMVEHILKTGSMDRAGVEDRHLSIFDCAVGRRSIRPAAHVEMLAAVQSFVSGAISKTINVPNDATVEDVKALYLRAWQLGVKCVAIYRDGSKLSQPLNTAAPNAAKPRLVVPEVVRTPTLTNPGSTRELPNKRYGYNQKARVGGLKIYVKTGEYPDGQLGEIFIRAAKQGAAFSALLDCFCQAVSFGLRYGVPLEKFVEAFIFTKFEPNGVVVGHDRIKLSTSIVDYIFRDLAINYLKREDLAHISPDELKIDAVNPDKTPQDMGFEGEACGTCGQFALVRSGTCLTCKICGSTSGGCS